MNIALIGYGVMGKLIEKHALERGHRLIFTVDPVAPDAHFQSISDIDCSNIDCAIEFTRPEAAVENIRNLASKGIPTVVGTTGWYSRLDEVQNIVEKAGSSLVYAANFSLGVNLFYRIAAFAANLMDPFPMYDVGGFEAHHNRKKDSPSGTAIALMEHILAAMKRKDTVLWDRLERPTLPNEIHMASLRAGAIPGTHSLCFDSSADTILIQHTARNREGFASGALAAAEWLTAQHRKGLFTIDDVLDNQ
ncbi:4-hydroxy-tetrahydrodipicolinate reductase [Spirochaetia bacterium]|nr:4-hydroxy-tetrahydrodipicolinate reductase [Spirochaetia bacterium]GHU38054.1 4-hydroxy-tetrahydrodipicolinate reductase [Spirochaetia bacterium]